MRALALLLALFATPLFARETGETRQSPATTAADESTWQELLTRARDEKKPIVILFQTGRCKACAAFRRTTISHPTIQRRLPGVIFSILPLEADAPGKSWGSEDSGVAFFDRSGALRARWPVVPDTTNFGVILDSVTAVAPYFERAARLFESGAAYDADVEAAIGLTRLGRIADARTALERARSNGGIETQQRAIIAGAVIDAAEGKRTEALADLDQVVATTENREILGDAFLVIGSIHHAAGAPDQAIRAFAAASEIVGPASPVQAVAQQALARLREIHDPAEQRVIRILPLERQVVSGRQTVKTHVAVAAVASVKFSLDGREISRVARPPFSSLLDFGNVPERRVIQVVGFDEKGVEIGRDERIVNHAGETFWLRLVDPREGPASGAVRVTVKLRVPPSRRVQQLTISWNDADRAVITAAPWESVVQIPSGQLGVLRAVAQLDDGRTTEDAVLLNASGAAEHASVQLVELPLTIMSRTGSASDISPERLIVREGRIVRRVEAISGAAETPLTVGLLIDSSASMQKGLPDVQEAAIRFLETALGPRDRAFLVTFDTRARLVQPATSDVDVLRRQIMSIRPDGLTALYDALAIGLLQFEGIKGRRTLVVFTDGLDRTSRYDADDIGELARRVNVPVHIIAAIPEAPPSVDPNALPGTAPPPPMQPATEWERAFRDLTRIADASGGSSNRLSDLRQVSDVYSRIENALRAQILAFINTDAGTRENDWRDITVTVTGADVKVRAPAGYYAPW